MSSKRNVLKTNRLPVNVPEAMLNACDSLSPSFRILLITVLAVCLMMLAGCSGKQVMIQDFQKPVIPPSLLVPQKQLPMLASNLYSDLPEYTFMVITEYNQCSANYNSLIDMVK